MLSNFADRPEAIVKKNQIRGGAMRPSISIKTVILNICLLMILIVTASAQDNRLAEYPVRFAIIGDRTGGHIPGVYGETVEEIERMRPDFVMTVGDMIEGYTADTAVLAKEWKEYDSLVAHLSMPIYYTPGNHDITMDEMQDSYEKYAGKPYYSFDQRGIHLIILDNSRFEDVNDFPEEQLNWLIDDLEKNEHAQYKLVFFHKPFWSKTIVYGKPDTLHSIFKEYGVDAVFNGHFHTYFYGEYDGIKYIDVGSSGADTEVGLSGIKFHFVWVTVDDDGIHVAPIVHDGVRDWKEVSAVDNEYVYTNRSKVIKFESPVEFDRDLKPLGSMVALAVNNPNESVGMNDTLTWDIPEGWTIEPSAVPVALGPGEETELQFRVRNNGAIYPCPTAEIEFPYAVGKYADARKSLGVARQAHCMKVSDKPKIDGKLDDKIWSDPVTMLFPGEGAEEATEPVEFYFAHDKKNLYLAARCQESQLDSMAAKITEHDGAIYGEDCVGYFFSPVKDTVYMIYINPNGAVFDQKITRGDGGGMVGDRGWNGDYKIETLRGDGFWTVEASIPIKSLGTKIGDSDRWKVNFRRKQRRMGAASDWLTPIEYDPDTYGYLIMD